MTEGRSSSRVGKIAATPRVATPTRGPKRVPGEMKTADFLTGLLDQTRARLPAELGECQTFQRWSLAKLWFDDAAIHYEVAPHTSRGRIEVALHFETRNPRHNAAMLEYFVEELLFLKAALGERLEAEPWDKGWTRVYLTLPLEALLPDFQQRVASYLAEFVETLEPILRDAAESVRGMGAVSATATATIDPNGMLSS